MSTMRIGIDLDGVLCNWVHAIRNEMATVAGRANAVPELEDAPSWDFAEAYGYTPAEFKEALRRTRQDGTFWATLPAYPGVHTFLDWLWRRISDENWSQNASHEVYFLTDRKGVRAKDQSELWLTRHGYSGKVPTVLITNGDKGRIVADLGLTHFLDDKIENVESAHRHAPNCLTGLRCRRWNVGHHDRLYAEGIAIIPDLKDFQRRLSSEF